MSFNAAALQIMLDKGMTLKDVTEIAAAMESRSKGAERQAKYRKRQKAGDVTNSDVTRDVTQPPYDSISNPPVSSEPEGSTETPTTPKNLNGNSAPSVSPEHVLEAWNVMASETGVPKARMTPERRKKLATFVRRHSIDDITEAIWAIPSSPFLCGENDRGWKAGIDFLLQPSSFTKIVEGTYDRSTH